jgi:alkane 1-monooxygenase
MSLADALALQVGSNGSSASPVDVDPGAVHDTAAGDDDAAGDGVAAGDGDAAGDGVAAGDGDAAGAGDAAGTGDAAGAGDVVGLSRTKPMTLARRLRRLLNAFGFVLLPYLIPVLVVRSQYLGGLWNFFPLLVIFGIVPVIDALIGLDPHNPSDDTLKALGEQRIFRWLTWAYVPLQVALIVYAAYVITHQSMSWLELTGFTLSLGTMTGALGITFAHELCHKPNRLEQALGKILLLTVCYMHFHIEHNQGHHVNVATPKDPATSRLGESFYRFYPRTVIGGFRGAWQLEARRLQRSGRPIWSVSNQVIWFVLLPIAFALALGALFGWPVVPFFFAQSVVAFTLLEIVNYLEHYGIERREIAPGRYERVTPIHSWNSNHRLTNGFLIMLQRHSDHHANPQRRYQTLRHFDESPQLPTGYAGMVVLALVPPLWFRVMNPRVLEHRRRIEAASTGGAPG